MDPADLMPSRAAIMCSYRASGDVCTTPITFGFAVSADDTNVSGTELDAADWR